MKKIINGKLYDTNTAKWLGTYSNEVEYNEYSTEEESLYRKKNGEFFLCGSGGPLTKYAVKEGNTTYGGSKITPMTEAMAKDWAEKHLDADKYIEIFGEVEE